MVNNLKCNAFYSTRQYTKSDIIIIILLLNIYIYILLLLLVNVN